MNFPEHDYYAILNLKRNATKQDIVLAYRKLAVRLNPHRDTKHEREFVPVADLNCTTHMRMLPLQRQWEYINMAYDVLGDDLLRSVYDRYGEAGLFQGILLPNGYFPPYQYDGDHMKVYHSVFGSYSPYANIIDAATAPPKLYNTKEHGVGVPTKDAPIEKLMGIDLEDVRFGATKLMHVWRYEFVDKEMTRMEKRKKTLTIYIAPGTTAGTRYTFKEQGDQCPTKVPGDIVFVAIDNPHEKFTRSNYHDLIYVHNITLSQALIGFNFVVRTLDHRNLRISITEVVRPGYVKLVPREGLPKCEDTGCIPPLKPRDPKEMIYGDLLIEFNVEFPAYLSRPMKILTRKFFAELKAMENEVYEEENPLQKLLSKK